MKDYMRLERGFTMADAKDILIKAKDNLKPGLTVSLVSVPLSLSLSVAAKGTPLMGVITAAWAGLFAALFSSSNYNIVGPTGALSGLLANYAQLYDTTVLPYLAIVSGLITLIIYGLKWQKYIMFIPSSVIHGFTIGVAFIIGLNQLNSAFGLKGLESHEAFRDNVWESLKHLGNTDWINFLIFTGVTAVYLLLIHKWPKAPWAILIAVLGIVLGIVQEKISGFHKLETLLSKYPEMDKGAGYMVVFPFAKFDKKYLTFDIVQGGAAIAFIAILETLISAKIADGMTKTKHDARKEVLGLGIANIVSGIVGGIPATAALARTALNIRSGATSYLSAIVNAFSVFAISLVLLTFFKYLPMCIVASILVVVAIRMIEVEHIIHLWKVDKKMFTLSIVVALLCIVSDPTTGILFGTVIALLMFSDALSSGHSDIIVNRGGRVSSHLNLTELDKIPLKSPASMRNVKSTGDLVRYGESALSNKMEHTSINMHETFHDTIIYRFNGELTYINSLAHVERLKRLNYENTILSLKHTFYLDLDGLDALEEITEDLTARGSTVYFTGVQEMLTHMLSKAPWFLEKQKAGFVMDTEPQCLQRIGQDTSSVTVTDVNKESELDTLLE
jgi:SulP family sulfate permease